MKSVAVDNKWIDETMCDMPSCEREENQDLSKMLEGYCNDIKPALNFMKNFRNIATPSKIKMGETTRCQFSESQDMQKSDGKESNILKLPLKAKQTDSLNISQDKTRLASNSVCVTSPTPSKILDGKRFMHFDLELMSNVNYVSSL